MGALSDTSLLTKNATFRDTIKAALMFVCQEVDAAPPLPDDATQEQRATRTRQQVMATTVVGEVQGAFPESYVARILWYVAMDSAVLPVLVKNGSIVTAEFGNDTLLITATRNAFNRAAAQG